MKTGTRHFAINVLVLLLFALPSIAQSDTPGVEVFGGYSHVSSDIGLNGWDFTAAFRPELLPSFSLVGDLGGAYGTDSVAGTRVKSSLYSALAGPRVHFNIRRDELAPFAEVLVGIARVSTDIGTSSDSDNAWAFSIGGGLDYAFTDSWTARVKAGVLRTHFFDDPDSRVRFAVGLVYRFGQSY
jgi:opacity protein-like surface antigen